MKRTGNATGVVDETNLLTCWLNNACYVQRASVFAFLSFLD